LLKEIKSFPRSLFMAGGGLRISEVKQKLTKYSSETIDEALLGLEEKGLIVLFRFDDPTRVTEADKKLALWVSGVVRHYFFVR
jgi:DNA-binding HxlR family transcriptional regulator